MSFCKENVSYFLLKSSVSEWEVMPKFVYSFLLTKENITCEKFWFLIIYFPLTERVACSSAYSSSIIVFIATKLENRTEWFPRSTPTLKIS